MTEDACCEQSFIGGKCTDGVASLTKCFKATRWWPLQKCTQLTGQICAWDPFSTYETEDECCQNAFNDGKCDTTASPENPTTCYAKDTYYPNKHCKEVTDVGGGECSRGWNVYESDHECCDSFYGGCDKSDEELAGMSICNIYIVCICICI